LDDKEHKRLKQRALEARNGTRQRREGRPSET